MSEVQLLELSLKVDKVSEDLADLLSKVERLTQRVAELELRSQGFSLVSSRPAASVSGATSTSSNGDYNQLASTIPALPEFVFQLCAGLVSSKLSARERALRAWEAGWWARFCLEEKLRKPRPTKPIELSNTCYIVLRADGHTCPILCGKASDYRSVVGQFTESTLSHGFPSLAEARVYCLGAGVDFPNSTYQWSSNSRSN